MTAREPLSPEREAEIRGWLDELGAGKDFAAVGPYSALRDTLGELDRTRGVVEQRTSLLQDVQAIARKRIKEANGRAEYGQRLKAENAALLAECHALRKRVAELEGLLAAEPRVTDGVGNQPSAGESTQREAVDPARFTAVASPVEYGYVIAIRRDPHPEGHVPVAMVQLRTEWSPEAADELLRAYDGYVTAPGSYWQPLEGGRYGIRLRRTTAPPTPAALPCGHGTDEKCEGCHGCPCDICTTCKVCACYCQCVDVTAPAVNVAIPLQNLDGVEAVTVDASDVVAVTVRPRDLDGWRWWLARFEVPVHAVTHRGGGVVTAKGTVPTSGTTPGGVRVLIVAHGVNALQAPVVAYITQRAVEAGDDRG